MTKKSHQKVLPRKSENCLVKIKMFWPGSTTPRFQTRLRA